MKIRYRKAALADLAGIRDFVRRSSPRAAREVVAEIRSRVSKLSAFAERYRAGSVEGTRELVITRYGYIVTYQIGRGGVTILAVFHTAQDKPRGG